MWHAFCGCWGGIRPNVERLPDSKVVGAQLSKGVEMTMTDLVVVKILKNGVGMVAMASMSFIIILK